MPGRAATREREGKLGLSPGARWRQGDGRGYGGFRACGGAAAGSPGAEGGRCVRDDGGGEVAGLPELEEVFEAGEQAGQDGVDQGEQGGGHDSPTFPRRGIGAHLGAEAGGPGWFE